MPGKNDEITFEGCEPSTLFREFAAECMELAQTASSPEKRALYLKMASMCFRWRSAGKRNASRTPKQHFSVSTSQRDIHKICYAL
jgi:hypothetical protein